MQKLVMYLILVAILQVVEGYERRVDKRPPTPIRDNQLRYSLYGLGHGLLGTGGCGV